MTNSVEDFGVEAGCSVMGNDGAAGLPSRWWRLEGFADENGTIVGSEGCIVIPNMRGFFRMLALANFKLKLVKK